MTPLSEPRFGFDPGHGGSNNGAWTPGGWTREADLTLSVGLAVQAKMGSLVYLTRDQDITISYEDRARAAANAGVDCMICGHYNSWKDSRRRGLRAFHYMGNGIMRRVARCASVNAPDKLAPGRVICAQSSDGTEGTDYLTTVYPMHCLVIEFGFLTSDRDRSFVITTHGIDECADLVVRCFEEYRWITTGKGR